MGEGGIAVLMPIIVGMVIIGNLILATLKTGRRIDERKVLN